MSGAELLGLIGVLGAAAIAGVVALVVHFTPRTPRLPPQLPQLTREQQLEALEKYANYLEVLRKELNAFRETYFGDYAKLTADGMVPEKAKEQLYGDIRQRVHDADLLATYSAMEAAFPDLNFKGVDWKKIISDGRLSFTEFLDAVHDVAISHNDPSADQTIKDRQESILGRHWEISQACKKLLIK